jgi:hypothetical protein
MHGQTKSFFFLNQKQDLNMKWTHLAHGLDHHSSHPSRGSLHLPCKGTGIHKRDKKMTFCRSFAETCPTSSSSGNMSGLAGCHHGNICVNVPLVDAHEDSPQAIDKHRAMEWQWGCGIDDQDFNERMLVSGRSPTEDRDQSGFEDLELGGSSPGDNADIPAFHTPCNFNQTKGTGICYSEASSGDGDESQQESWPCTCAEMVALGCQVE